MSSSLRCYYCQHGLKAHARYAVKCEEEEETTRSIIAKSEERGENLKTRHENVDVGVSLVHVATFGGPPCSQEPRLTGTFVVLMRVITDVVVSASRR
jgi:hypothetical protein